MLCHGESLLCVLVVVVVAPFCWSSVVDCLGRRSIVFVGAIFHSLVRCWARGCALRGLVLGWFVLVP